MRPRRSTGRVWVLLVRVLLVRVLLVRVPLVRVPRSGFRWSGFRRRVPPVRAAGVTGPTGGWCRRSPTPTTAPSRPRCGPSGLADFVGQQRVHRDQLSLVLESAVRRGHPPDHVLLSGPPGLGKTTIAMIIAAELGTPMRITSGPAIERSGDLAAVLSTLAEGEVVFIDEIHRLARPAEEMLYLAMEDFRVDVVVGKGPGRDRDPAGHRAVHAGRRDHPVRAAARPAARPVRLHRAHGLLPARGAGDHHPPVGRAARRHAAGRWRGQELAGRSRGTPRIANRLLRRVRDYAEVRGDGVVNRTAARRRAGPVRGGRGGPGPAGPRRARTR